MLREELAYVDSFVSVNIMVDFPALLFFTDYANVVKLSCTFFLFDFLFPVIGTESEGIRRSSCCISRRQFSIGPSVPDRVVAVAATARLWRITKAESRGLAFPNDSFSSQSTRTGCLSRDAYISRLQWIISGSCT